MQVVKEFTKILIREKKRVFKFSFQGREGARAALKNEGLSLFLGFKGQGAGMKRWVHVYFGLQLYPGQTFLYRMWFF